MPLAYVVVLNWNLKNDTVETVESVLRSSYRNVRVVVVDNGSDDGSPQFLSTRFPSISIISLSENVGYAAGNNVGIKYALEHGADYVLLLNNDTIVDRDFLQNMLKVAEKEPQLGVLAPIIYYFDRPGIVWQCGAKDRVFPPLPVDLTIKDLRGAGRVDQEFSKVDYVTGCAMLIKRDVLEVVGLLDERYFMYYEDSDFCIRARRQGYMVGVVHKANIWHKVASSTKKALPFQRYVRAKSRIMFYKRFSSGLRFAVLAPFLFVSTLRMVIRDSCRGRTSLVGWYARGLYEGFRSQR